ncbi:ABC transporter permease [Flexivirga oryzae]|uniref:ABC-2 type transport system permease protein n=1 Tax=Flexivirga oryzae TaxID=1794944 RepID=A0A839MZN7_9MICO|nr:ABC transporter permease subunit [Flexivirga oryzae]MBB2890059.1 ABC-2 type transport system permease protein [Flexivirga oryzae]
MRFFRSELRLIMGRRRNQAGLVVLAAMPVILGVAVRLTESNPRGDGPPGFIDDIVGNGVFLAFAALTFELTLFFPLAIAMVSGDAIAGEAHSGTLRYLLTVPAGRTRVLIVKYLGIVAGSFIATLTVAVAGAVAGILLFGTGPLTTLSGDQIPLGAGLWRLLISAAYVAFGLCALGALGLFISTLTEQPIAATVALMIVTATMWVLDAIPQISWLHPWLLVDRWDGFADLMRNPADFGTVRDGVLVTIGYIVVCLLLAWARFDGKDITS